MTIGSFDGVHVGHVALIQAARARVGPTGRVVAIAFDPHPFAVLPTKTPPTPLTSFDQRAALLRQAGADEVVRLEPTRTLLSLHPERFIDLVLEKFNPVVFVEGEDFRFGRDRFGDIALLKASGQVLGFDVEVVPGVDVQLTDQTIVRASSTIARWLLAHGRVEDLAAVLGRAFRIQGTVSRGDQRGRTIGFPTANLAIETSLPADAVYAATAQLPDGSRFPAAVNIGTRPTVNGTRRRVEAHILFDGTSPTPEINDYGWWLQLDLHAWIRDQVRFADLDALAAQLCRDCNRLRCLYSLVAGGALG